MVDFMSLVRSIGDWESSITEKITGWLADLFGITITEFQSKSISVLILLFFIYLIIKFLNSINKIIKFVIIVLIVVLIGSIIISLF